MRIRVLLRSPALESSAAAMHQKIWANNACNLLTLMTQPCNKGAMWCQRTELSSRLPYVGNRCQRLWVVAKSKVALHQQTPFQKQPCAYGSAYMALQPARYDQGDPSLVEIPGVKLYYPIITINPMPWLIYCHVEVKSKDCNSLLSRANRECSEIIQCKRSRILFVSQIASDIGLFVGVLILWSLYAK